VLVRIKARSHLLLSGSIKAILGSTVVGSSHQNLQITTVFDDKSTEPELLLLASGYSAEIDE
jgi:hypothetical protein